MSITEHGDKESDKVHGAALTIDETARMMGVLPDRVQAWIEIERQMQALTGPGDPESAHAHADDLLLEALSALAGDVSTKRFPFEAQEVAERIAGIISAFNAIKKWYA